MSGIYLMKADLSLINMARWAAEERHSDPDRTAHCLLVESFGPEAAPRPFVIMAREENGQPQGSLLAYTCRTAEELRESAERHQRLAHAAVLDPETIRTVRTPSEWEEGQTLEFEIRVRPVKRSSNRQHGQEQDFFLASPEGSNRTEIYCTWLASTMSRQGALSADPENMIVKRLALRRVRRQNASGWHTAPDVTIVGTAKVMNPELMEQAMTKGLGRHKGYGYGMLLLRRPEVRKS
ncbi:MAG: type I-E CRISPR-associated protein Cas6/Cse3/CasE [Chloroflexota bacterium]|nr:type I-E CRISPR-associated protein Cas6/Cse3/CasE [Chloroflexota bacterium]